MPSHAPVTVAVPVLDPDRENFARTLASLTQLNPQPDELVIVDQTPGGFRIGGTGSGCGTCGEPVSDALEAVKRSGITVDVIEDETIPGIGAARRVGLLRASNPFVWHLDEDTAIISSDWIQRALDRLEEDGVVGVGGGRIENLGEDFEGRMMATVSNKMALPSSGWKIMHPRRACVEEQCFLPGQHRGDDFSLRKALRKQGRIVREPGLGLQADLPTTNQGIVRDVVVAGLGGLMTTGAVLVAREGWRKLRGAG